MFIFTKIDSNRFWPTPMIIYCWFSREKAFIQFVEFHHWDVHLRDRPSPGGSAKRSRPGLSNFDRNRQKWWWNNWLLSNWVVITCTHIYIIILYHIMLYYITVYHIISYYSISYFIIFYFIWFYSIIFLCF